MYFLELIITVAMYSNFISALMLALRVSVLVPGAGVWVGWGGVGEEVRRDECVTSCPAAVWPRSEQQWHLVGVGVLLCESQGLA